MHEAIRAITVSREYALEQKEEIVKKYGPMQMWSTEDEADHNYWEGQCDALERALMAIQKEVS